MLGLKIMINSSLDSGDNIGSGKMAVMANSLLVVVTVMIEVGLVQELWLSCTRFSSNGS